MHELLGVDIGQPGTSLKPALQALAERGVVVEDRTIWRLRAGKAGSGKVIARRLAAAALLVHAAAIDGEMTQSERDKLHAVVMQRFALDDAATDELIEKATAAEHESVDLYHFTHLLNRALDASDPAAANRIMSRSVRMPMARSSWSITTTEPTLCSRMRCAASATVSAGCAVTTG